MTTAEKTLKWWNDYLEQNKTYPLVSEIEMQLNLAVDNEPKVENLAIHDVSISLRKDAIECLDALKYWDKQEFKNALNDGHTLDGMRPMILTKKLLKKLSNEC